MAATVPSLSELGDRLQERRSLSSTGGVLERRGNVDVYQSALEGGGREIANCHTYTLLPFTDQEKRAWNGVSAYEAVAALALAAQHLNTGNGTIVPEIEGFNEKCPLRFTVEVSDTELEERIAVNQVIGVTNRPSGASSSNIAGGNNNNQTCQVDPSQDPGGILPCFFVGAMRSAISIPTSIITGLRGYPQLSPLSTSTALNDAVQHPLFGRTIPADDGTAIPFITYLRETLNVKYLAVIHINDSYGNAFGQGLQVAAATHAPDLTVQTVDIPVSASEEAIRRAVSFLKETNYAYLFGILFPVNTLDGVMTEAVRQGIAGTGLHNWFFSDTSWGDIERSFERTSALGRAFQGAGIISASAGSEQFNPALGRLTRGLQDLKRDVRNIEYIASILPHHDHANFVQYDVFAEDYLETPGLMGPFVYDIMISSAMAACHVYQKHGRVDGTAHFESIVSQNYTGTSGRVLLNPETGTRLASTAFFQLLNHVEDPAESTETHVQYKAVLADIFQQGQWMELEPYVFNDGTTTVQSDMPPVDTDPNYFSTTARVGGLFMCMLVICLALAMMIWTKLKENHRVVRASQPIFLYIICIGCIVFSSAIIPLSIDQGVAPESGCDIACQTVPWLLFIGFSLIFSALFTKTYRINRILGGGGSFKRIKLTAWDVAKPMMLLLGLNVFMLTIQSVFAPLYWEFEVERRDAFGQPLEGYGFCSADDAWPYLITVAVLNFGALCFAVVQAFHARNISIEFAESDYIFRSMISILLVCFLGVPVLVLARDNSDAYFFVFSAILFLSSTCILLFIFAPKIQYLRQDPDGTLGPEEYYSQRASSRNSFMITQQQPGDGGLPAFERTYMDRGESRLPKDDYGDGDDDDDKGLRVLTTKTQQQLLDEVKLLRAKLKSAVSENRTTSIRHSQFLELQQQQAALCALEDAAAAESHPAKQLEEEGNRLSTVGESAPLQTEEQARFVQSPSGSRQPPTPTNGILNHVGVSCLSLDAEESQ